MNINHLEVAKKYVDAMPNMATVHALIAIAEQIEKMNDNVTDIGIVNGWWALEDRLEHAIRKQQEDK